MTKKLLSPIHPGEILLEEFLKPTHITPTKLASRIKVPIHYVNKVCQGKKGITPDLALRLAFYFNMKEAGMNF